MASEDDCQAKSPLADISKAKELLGYKPQVGFEEGLRKTVEYFETHQFANAQTNNEGSVPEEAIEGTDSVDS